MTYSVGQRPGRGAWRCTFCGSAVHLDDAESLPPCRRCERGAFTYYTDDPSAPAAEALNPAAPFAAP